MPAVAIVGSEFRPFIENRYVFWERERDDEIIADDYKNAEVTGQVSNGSTKLFIQGIGIARESDTTYEHVKSITTPTGSGWQRRTPLYGNGEIIDLVSRKLFVEGRAIALVGSKVRSHVNSIETSLRSGSSKFFVSQ